MHPKQDFILLLLILTFLPGMAHCHTTVNISPFVLLSAP